MKKQGFLKGSAILLISTVITKALGLVYRIPLTRLLGGTGMGYFAAAFSVFTPILAVFAAGIPSTLARAAAENYALERFGNLRRTKRVAAAMFCGVSLAASVLVAIAAVPLSKALSGSAGSGVTVMCIAPSLFFCTVISVYRGYYEGLHNMYPTAVSEIIETVFRLVLGLGFAYAVHSYCMTGFAKTGRCFGVVCENAAQAHQTSLVYVAAAAILGTSLSSGIACVYMLIRSRLRGDGITPQMLGKDSVAEPSGRIAKHLLASCMPIAFTALITTFSGMIDMLAVAPCVSAAMKSCPQAFEKYLGGSVSAEMLPNFVYGSFEGLAAAVAGLVPTLTAMLGKSTLPSAAESFAKGDVAAVGASVNKMLTLSAFIAFPSGIGISVFSEDILHLLFGGRTQEIAVAAPCLRVLGAAVVLMSLSLPCFTLLQALGRSRTAVTVMLLGGAVKLCADLVFITTPATSVIGAALADVLSEGFICVCAVRATCRLAKTHIDWKNVFFKPVYCGAMSIGTAFLLRSFLLSQQFFAAAGRTVTAFCIVFSVIMYLIMTLVLCEMPKNVVMSLFCKKNRKKDLKFSEK